VGNIGGVSMYDRMQTFTNSELETIHDASLRILQEIGVAFPDEEARNIFKKHNIKIEGQTVFLEEKTVRNAVESAPSQFTITARNPEHNVIIGEEHFACAPGYGSPFVVTADGQQRQATMEDYDNFCKLVQTSKYLDMNGFMMVEPSDVPSQTAHLDMLFSGMTLSDKAFMGSPVSAEGARDALDMAGIVWGQKDQIVNKPVMISLINSLSPLKYSEEMSGSLIELARYGQPCILASLIMAGTSGPVQITGLLALQNAEILAGITLTQLINPGTPVIYGTASSITDMKTGGLCIGAPEQSLIVTGIAQLARFYNLPSRGGGGLTDAHVPDMQAGIESAFALLTAARNGINFILHSCGILDSYLSMSFEKFLLDEELCGMVKKVLTPIKITEETIDVDMIKEVGIGGQFLTQPATVKLCRKAFFMPRVLCRESYTGWEMAGKQRADDAASLYLDKRLNQYTKPPIDEGIEQALAEFVRRKKRAVA
jgi:trimethylamine---corrinoid protein Co-methyltransferase